ncbi:MAG: hypothetical protein HC883_02010 [Bdellovibrionaceae bacterium]|nr:hypothetical protein [Pseudobdellovibrionaceae bacterium]
MVAANTFLPFTSHRGIDQADFLKTLPDAVDNKKIRIAFLHPYFSDGLVNYLRKIATKAGYELEFIALQSEEWFAAFNHPETDKFDFILSAYVASERFPSVQLRYLLEGYKIPFNISMLDDPDWTSKQVELLSEVQKYILKEQIVVPLFFVKNQIRHSSTLDIGDQPILDADIQLWRVKRSD